MWICKSEVEIQGRGGFVDLCIVRVFVMLGFWHGVEWCERMWGRGGALTGVES
ncbi:hypothetical protein [Bartonella grahamii]|uniref:hypothetical protein n=1 Tax=Bartonella grahamii TaxID=33045 RepID=UPI002E7C5309|nr:hypothetical protein [Bartonella grahamii]